MEILEGKIKSMEEDLTQMEEISLRFRRNFRGMPFTPLMTKESKL